MLASEQHRNATGNRSPVTRATETHACGMRLTQPTCAWGRGPRTGEGAVGWDGGHCHALAGVLGARQTAMAEPG
eukprot:1159763-Pelagomonas_calceolata.AAC.6